MNRIVQIFIERMVILGDESMVDGPLVAGKKYEFWDAPGGSVAVTPVQEHREGPHWSTIIQPHNLRYITWRSE